MQPSSYLPGYDGNDLKLLEIFYPYFYKKTALAFHSKARFVHYTSADTATRIIQGEEVWLRKSTCMNDFMEIEHGFECLQHAYREQKERFKGIFEGMFPDFCQKIESRFNAWLPILRNGTYIACISEHDEREDRIGRLSMWRAYGGSAGVALVLKGLPLLTPTDALQAYTSPVAYLDKEGFEEEFCFMLDLVEQNSQLIERLGEENVIGKIFEVFRMATLCTKHPGFAEEREWRIIYSPSYSESTRIKQSVETVGGVPQRIYKIPLRNVPEENLVGIEIAEFIERIIVGPSQFPIEIRDALSVLLDQKGVQDASERITISDIPLRN
ncbi:DUF2971 domain-containing protein [Sinorhizobium meliloti]|nr:DUF2971 domain-containing protein [Sinorhizobium meliloti]MDX0311428.1 DUF2971 domain-containing protein [Sinorhizobium meliloti]